MKSKLSLFCFILIQVAPGVIKLMKEIKFLSFRAKTGALMSSLLTNKIDKILSASKSSSTEKKICEMLDELIVKAPRVLLTTGQNLLTENAFAEKRGIVHIIVLSYQANPVLCVNCVLTIMITMFLDHRKWDVFGEIPVCIYRLSFVIIGDTGSFNLNREPQSVNTVRERLKANIEIAEANPKK